MYKADEIKNSSRNYKTLKISIETIIKNVNMSKVFPNDLKTKISFEENDSFSACNKTLKI